MYVRQQMFCVLRQYKTCYMNARNTDEFTRSPTQTKHIQSDIHTSLAHFTSTTKYKLQRLLSPSLYLSGLYVSVLTYDIISSHQEN